MNEERTLSGGTRVAVIAVSQLSLSLPLFSSVSAGFPSPADDYTEERLNLDQYLIKNPASTFFVRVEGMSMIGAGIYPDDILIVDKSQEAKSGDVIVAVLEGEFTVKRLVRERGKYYLRPENDRYQPIELNADIDFQVWGVVTNVIHKPYEL